MVSSTIATKPGTLVIEALSVLYFSYELICYDRRLHKRTNFTDHQNTKVPVHNLRRVSISVHAHSFRVNRVRSTITSRPILAVW
jgi:hypothetical protein